MRAKYVVGKKLLLAFPWNWFDVVQDNHVICLWFILFSVDCPNIECGQICPPHISNALLIAYVQRKIKLQKLTYVIIFFLYNSKEKCY